MPLEMHNSEPVSATRQQCESHVSIFETNDGKRFTVRPIRPQDEPLLADFHRELSNESVYRRYFAPMKLEARVAHERLLRRCAVDGHEQVALVAEHRDERGSPHIVGVARLVRISGTNSAELAFAVADRYQHRGLGGYLLRQMMEIGREQHLQQLEAEVLADNYDMKELFRLAGFRFTAPEAGVVRTRLTL